MTLPQKPPREVSSIDGILELISIGDRLHISIEEYGTRKRIRCILPDDLFETAKAALGKRVVIEGTAHLTTEGDPSLLTQITDLWVRPDETRRLEDLRGAEPDFTGDDSAEEYVRTIREQRNGLPPSAPRHNLTSRSVKL